jgi:hypothetical protein
MKRRIEYAVIASLEEITYFENDDGDWEEDTRSACLEEIIHKSPDHEENRERYELILQKLRGEGGLTKREGTRLIRAMAYGLGELRKTLVRDGKFATLDKDGPFIVAEVDYNTIMRNVVSEIAHSMNRKGLLSNDGTDEFIKLAYEEMKI